MWTRPLDWRFRWWTHFRGLLAGYGWKAVLMKGSPKASLNAVTGAASYLPNLGTPGNQQGEESLAAKYRRFSSQASREPVPEEI